MFPKALQAKQVQLQYQMEYNAWIDTMGLAPLMQFIPTDKETVNLVDFADVPLIEEIVGDFKVNTLGKYEFNVGVKKYGAALGFDLHELSESGFSSVNKNAISLLAQAQAQHVSDLLLDTTLPGLASAAGLDGSSFFATSHPIDGGTQANTVAITAGVANTTAPTLAEADFVFEKLKLLLRVLKSSTGRYINAQVKQWYLFCPLSWESVFMQLFNPTNLAIAGVSAGSAAATFKNQNQAVKVIGCAFMSDASATCPIYLAATGPGIRPPIAHVQYVAPHRHMREDGLNETRIEATSGRYDLHPFDYKSMVRGVITNA